MQHSIQQARLADIERIEAEQERLAEKLLEEQEKELEELRVTIDNVTYVGYEVLVSWSCFYTCAPDRCVFF